MDVPPRRALISTALALIGATVGIAGLGHAYLRRWRRAVAWFLFVLGAGLVLVSVFTDPRSVTPSTLPAEVTIPVLFLLAISTVDAYRLASRSAGGKTTMGTEEDADGPACPNCGRSVDPSLAFCWYCAEPTGSDDAADETA